MTLKYLFAFLAGKAWAFRTPLWKGIRRPGLHVHPSTTTRCRMVSNDLEPGQILVASDENKDKPISFDTSCVAYPVVIPPWQSNCSEWKLIYYGRGPHWNDADQSTPALLPTGWVGLATSPDGIHNWTKVAGSEQNGSILAPSSTPSDFDSLHLGHGDIVMVNETYWLMYYFGGSSQESNDPERTTIPTGFDMQIGRAVSHDQGMTWTRKCDEGSIFQSDYENEGWFAAWPRIIIDPTDSDTWYMIYHSFNGSHWRVFGASSKDQGDTWTRANKEPLLTPGGSPSAWDSRGIGTRCTIPYKDPANSPARTAEGKRGTKQQQQWLMIYEAVDERTTHRIGAALADHPLGPYSKQDNVNPILEPGVGPLPTDWTSVVVGTPYVVQEEEPANDGGGALRLYFVSRGEAPHEKHSIGMVISDSGDWRGPWRVP